ncbi:glycoside hydrolase family 65 protein [Carnobacterium maltaromaticum]|uniref:glycoside hydrolase family 65 protein n=1 Tax=Carnobacterium maltaromaticum TaxID=2751 RepID=UPI00295EF078|nr:glycosyl hydrolase family 65 protein [Carnobacterium maltaromaticum]
MKTSVRYDEKNPWIIEESFFNQEWLAKYETIFYLGNGYMGLRSATEENYVGEKRDLLVAGTFNKFDENEVTELPNLADLTQIKIKVNEQTVDLTKGAVSQYVRRLDLKTGELFREFIWTTPKGEEIAFKFKRIVSMKRLHVIAQSVEITPLNQDIEVSIESGIDGQVTNNGSQHFTEGEKHLYEEKYIQMIPKTTQSAIAFVVSTVTEFYVNNQPTKLNSRIEMKRRQVFNNYWGNVAKNVTLRLEKISTVYSTRDKDQENHTLTEIEKIGYEALKETSSLGYEVLQKESAKAWQEKVWNIAPITIDSTDTADQLAINFAKYHLHAMTPAHDNRMNIAAKGLSGEGYKGHTFWDTEIFMLPYFIYTHPEIAKSLVEYRYLGLQGAHKKAAENGYEGAQFPWEAAWVDDGETTPVWGAADIVTGKATKIWSGFIEQHITSDVAYGVNQYIEATGDQEFLETKGYELLLDTAKFWASRLEWNAEKQNYQINEVIGPDEYKEHVNNNAFTNYTAHWNIKKAIEIYDELQKNQPLVFDRLNKKIGLAKIYPQWVEKVDLLFLPQANQDGVIPQDDTYLGKKMIDLSGYKAQEQVGGLFHDYNLNQVNEMQITKQADVMLLLFLFENWFTTEEKLANWNYYEPKTMHDSSLSLSTHSVLAADLGKIELSYKLFKQAVAIDMGTAMKSSDEGIHAASLGGIWQMTVFGFGGVRALNGQLRIDPNLPPNWKSVCFSIFWHQEELEVVATKTQLTVTNKTGGKAISFTCQGKAYQVKESVTIELEK